MVFQILIILFTVPKCIGDICIVYYKTANGFNNSLWVPNFCMSNMQNLLRGTGTYYWMIDLDIGDMF